MGFLDNAKKVKSTESETKVDSNIASKSESKASQNVSLKQSKTQDDHDSIKPSNQQPVKHEQSASIQAESQNSPTKSLKEKNEPILTKESILRAKEELQSTQKSDSIQDKREKDSSKSIVEESNSLDIGDEQAHEFLLGLQEGSNIQTIADTILDKLVEQKKSTFKELAQHCQSSIPIIEKFCKILSYQKRVRIEYPLIFTQPPKVILLEREKIDGTEKAVLSDDKKLLEEYTVMSDYVVADIHIWSVPKENTPIYEVISHKVPEGTQLVLEYLTEELAEKTPIESGDATDPRKIFGVKKDRFDLTLQEVKKTFSDVSDDVAKFLSGIVIHQSFGLGDMEIIMSDNWLEEIAINGNTEPLSVYHKRYGWLKTTKHFDAENGEIYNIASQIARKVGKQINALSPIMDAHLQTGDRVAATLFPISTEGDTLTIRRFARNPWTVVHMIDPKNHTMSKEVMSFLWQAIQYELNFLVVGGTASGKTSALNTMAALIPPTNRILSIEDTREISLPKALHWNWVPLASKSSNAEGQGEVSMLDLMVASLRMRPDRIIVGEIRRKQQAEAMFEAMHTGHSVCATMHADTAEQIKHRLTQPPIDIPENELQALQLILVQYRDRRRGVRRTLEVAELLPGGSDEKINLNYLFRWQARGDKFVKEEASVRVVEDLNLHTGMTEKEINNDLSQKEKVLEWMLKNKVFDVDKVGHIMRIYYKYPQLLLDTISDEASADNILKS